jgi:hypothetical protein
MQRVLSRSLRLRQVSAGGCNACEADCNVLVLLAGIWGRYGIQLWHLLAMRMVSWLQVRLPKHEAGAFENL